MYKYVKGITVLSEERMPSSLEIAKEYHLWMPETDPLTPNGELVDFIVKVYIDKNNLKVSEYFYIDEYNISFKVYPEKFIKQVMSEFVIYLEHNNIIMSDKTVYTFCDMPFIYYKKPNQENKVLSFEKYKNKRKKKGSASHDKLPEV